MHMYLYSTSRSTGAWLAMEKGDLDCVCSETGDACEDCRASWRWDDLSPMEFWNWEDALGAVEPNSLSSRYGMIATSGVWKDTTADQLLEHCCKRDEVSMRSYTRESHIGQSLPSSTTPTFNRLPIMFYCFVVFNPNCMCSSYL